MDILEFLAKNFYFILIALFFVARLFSNSGKKGQTPGRMPDFSGEMTPSSPPERSPEPRPVPQQSRPAPQQERPDTVYRTQMSRDQREVDEFPGAHRIEESADRSRQSYGASSHQGRARTAARGASDHAANAQIAGPGKGLAKDDLRKAFIWSEVLGPPKAKRPYRRS